MSDERQSEKQRHLAGEVHEEVGVPHGHTEANGETVHYLHDEDGSFVGWEKVPEGGHAQDDTRRPAGEDQEAAARDEFERLANGEDVYEKDRQDARRAVLEGIVKPDLEADEHSIPLDELKDLLRKGARADG
jgi:hypothetical protein